MVLDALSNEVGLLRTLAAHLEKLPIPSEPMTQAFLRREGLGHVREKEGCIFAIRIPGHNAFADLTDCLLKRIPALARGVERRIIQDELFGIIEAYIGRIPSAIKRGDAEALVDHFTQWFASRASPRRVFVPCVICRTAAPRFEIGPVTFEYINRVQDSDFMTEAANRAAFDSILKWMREEEADWLARVSVAGCDRERGEEIAELGVDLVIVALHLAAPYLDTRTMTRLVARRGASVRRTLSEANGMFDQSWTRNEPGMSIGTGTLPFILDRASHVIGAVGNMISSFTGGSYRCPMLEQAWCDAAYWFYQALREQIDSIAMTKLETSLEVLFRAESTTGSGQRILDVIEIFFRLRPDDYVAPGSSLSAKQFARKVVSERSCVLHGTSSTLNSRGMDRGGMEIFVGTVLRETVLELDDYIRSADFLDSPNDFIQWVRQRRSVLPV